MLVGNLDPPPDERGQATVSFVATVPALIGVGVVLAQVALIGFTAWSAAGSARAAARAELVGADPERAAVAALPGLLGDRVRLRRSGVLQVVEVVAPRVSPCSPRSVSARRWVWTRSRAMVAEPPRPRRRAGGPGDTGQAQLELVAMIPAVVAIGAVLLQLLAVGHAQSLADGAAEAGAIAVASDRPVDAAALAALGGWAGDRAEVSQSGGRIAVEVRPLSLIPGLGRHLGVSSRAWARPPASPEAGP